MTKRNPSRSGSPLRLRAFYGQKGAWKLLLVIGAGLIVVASLWYTSAIAAKISTDEKETVRLWAKAIENKSRLISITRGLFDRIAAEERRRIELWARATRMSLITEIDEDRAYYFDVIRSNTSIPVIQTDDSFRILDTRNFEQDGVQGYVGQKLSDSLRRALRLYEPIPLISPNFKQYVFYRDSRIFYDLKRTLDDLLNTFISDILDNSASVPVILTDSSGRLIAFGNVDSSDVMDSLALVGTLAAMQADNEPLAISLTAGQTQYVYYHDSYLLIQIRYYPIVQFGIIGLFLLVAYTAFSTARRVEQNQVWVGMSKETAHQLGTPISSLVAWVELLQTSPVTPELIEEMRKDVARLELVADRFSKIGSEPVLREVDLEANLNQILGYLQKRVSRHVDISIAMPEDAVKVKVNAPLFHWVIENLVKNAVDAMQGEGQIHVKVLRHQGQVQIDVSDTGKGIPSNRFKAVFRPGYSTKKRGWGLGLSLAKRIMVNYHNGRIFVAQSSAEGTTFRIMLPASESAHS